MKVKLLKKLRLRFIWFYDKNHYNEWRVFDKINDREVFGLPDAGYYYSERTILMMLRIIGEPNLWQSRKEKFEKIRLQKHQKAIKNMFLTKEVKSTK